MSAATATPQASAGAHGGTLTGTAPLLRTSIKHDGSRFLPWIVIATFLSASSVLAYAWVFPTEQDQRALAGAIGGNPALGLIFGPAFDLTTADGFNAWHALALGGFIAGLGAIFTVTRATRGQEDSGQAELLASGVLGRGSRLLAAVGMGLIGSFLLGLVAALVTVLCGGGWGPTLLLCATFTITGWMFTGVAAVTAQLGSDARTANSIAVGTLAVLFVLRGFAYSVEAPSWTVWINPLGWMTETRPASGDHWWPLLPTVVLTMVLLGIGFALSARRDFGQGAVAPKPGPDRGVVHSPLRLILRLDRGPIVTWVIAFAGLGVVFGYLATSLPDLATNGSGLESFLGANGGDTKALVSAFLVTILSMVGIIAAIPGVQTMLKVRTEEMEDRVEPLIATSVSRSRYLGANVLVALGGPTLYVLIAGAVIGWLASGAGIGITFGDTLWQAVVTVPAVWTVVAVSVAVVGARPALSIAAWAGVLASFVLTLLGPTFGLDDWVLGISPFWHLPQTQTASPDYTGLVWITLFTLAFLALGFVGFRRRDLARQ